VTTNNARDVFGLQFLGTFSVLSHHKMCAFLKIALKPSLVQSTRCTKLSRGEQRPCTIWNSVFHQTRNRETSLSICCYHRMTLTSPSASYWEDTYLQVLIIYTLWLNPLPAKVKMNHLSLQ